MLFHCHLNVAQGTLRHSDYREPRKLPFSHTKTTCCVVRKQKPGSMTPSKEQVGAWQFVTHPTLHPSPFMPLLSCRPEWHMEWSQRSCTQSHTHPRPICLGWWHLRWRSRAGWRPPPRSRRAWRGRGRVGCSTCTVARHCSPRSLFPGRTICAKQQNKQSRGYSSSSIITLVFTSREVVSRIIWDSCISIHSSPNQ